MAITVTSSSITAAISCAVIATALAGCGGSSSNRLSRSQIVAKANQICAAGTAAAKRVPQPANIQDAAAAAKYFNAVEPIASRSTAQLAALKPDDSVKSDWNAYLATRRTGLALLETIRRKANAHDPSGLIDLQHSVGLQQQVIAAAKTLGADQCAQ